MVLIACDQWLMIERGLESRRGILGVHLSCGDSGDK